MLNYTIAPSKLINYHNQTIASFLSSTDSNVDLATISSFGREWNSFHNFDEIEIERIGNEYFDIVNQTHINKNSCVLDVGCGSGRWSGYISSKVAFVEGIDPSDAIYRAVDNTSQLKNVRITQAGVDLIPFEDCSFDFVFSLGVLHHIPDTLKAMQQCVKKLKPGGYFLVYLYYNFENKGWLFKCTFKLINVIRIVVSKFPFFIKKNVCDFIALVVYLPLSLLSKIVKKMFKNRFYQKIPLSYYCDKSFYVMRNDALDRFGTPLEQRFSKIEIQEMMEKAGLRSIVFSGNTPYWHAIGQKY